MGIPRGIVACRFSEGVSEYIDWRRSVRAHAANSVRSSEYTLRRMEKALGNPMLYNLERKDVNRFMAKRSQNLRDTTANTERGLIRAFLTWCTEERYCLPERHLTRDLGYIKPVKHERRRLTADQFSPLYDSAEFSRDRMLLVILTDTLMRSSEATGLRWGGIGFQAGEVEFMRWKGKKVDTLPMSAPLEQELRRYWIWYESKIDRPIEPDDYVLPSIKLVGGPGARKTDDACQLLPKTRWSGHVHNVVQRSLVAIGFEGEPGPATLLRQEGGHTLRRSAARELLEALFQDPDLNHDEALLIVMTMLGHASLDMTMRYIGYDRDKEKAFRLLKGKDWWRHTRPAEVLPLRPASDG